MRVVTWNILHGGGTRRTPLIALRLCEISPDLVVLTEFRRTMGGQIAGVLFDRGLVHQRSTDPPPGRNGVFVASRTRLEPGETGPGAWAAHRWLDLRLPDLGATLTAVHAPDTHRSDAGRVQRQAVYWQHLVRLCSERRGTNHLIAGDLNTGRHGLDERGRTFTGTVFLGRISTMGYRDAFRVGQPSAAAPTWRSHTGSGFRIDAVWVSGPLESALRGAWHEGSAREENESDHAPVVADLALPERAWEPGPAPEDSENPAKIEVPALATRNLVR